ncbi:MAG: hypothetical protein HY842_02810 [Bacteroidetes bacterium]|nr:hypothetical protein [Bacteroidota bacterium]
MAEIPVHAASGTISLGDELTGHGVYSLRLVGDGQGGEVVVITPILRVPIWYPEDGAMGISELP